MKKSLIGRGYIVKDNSYSKDLSGEIKSPLLYNRHCIIIHEPYTECVRGKTYLFVDVVVPNNEIYNKHYRVLFFEWGLLDKGKREQIDIPILGMYGTIYHPTYNTDKCRMVDNENVFGYLMDTDCEIISKPFGKRINNFYCEGETSIYLVIKVRSLETGIEYIIPYKEDWVVKPIPTNKDIGWNFCPYCGKKLQ